jgi:pimeloyl-ACP methyl ester carboxylesterase
MERNRHTAFDYLESGHRHMNDPDYWKAYLRDMWPAWSTLTEHGADELQRITSPTLVVVGDRDPFQPVPEAVELYQHLPNAELAVIPGMDHAGPLGDRAQLLSQVVLNFLVRQVEQATV